MEKIERVLAEIIERLDRIEKAIGASTIEVRPRVVEKE